MHSWCVEVSGQYCSVFRKVCARWTHRRRPGSVALGLWRRILAVTHIATGGCGDLFRPFRETLVATVKVLVLAVRQAAREAAAAGRALLSLVASAPPAPRGSRDGRADHRRDRPGFRSDWFPGRTLEPDCYGQYGTLIDACVQAVGPGAPSAASQTMIPPLGEQV